MIRFPRIHILIPHAPILQSKWARPAATLLTILLLAPALAVAQSPFDSGFTAMQTLFLRILAKSERYNVRYDAAKQSVPRVEVI